MRLQRVAAEFDMTHLETCRYWKDLIETRLLLTPIRPTQCTFGVSTPWLGNMSAYSGQNMTSYSKLWQKACTFGQQTPQGTLTTA